MNLLESTQRVILLVYGHSIEKDVKGDTSGYFQKILVALLMGQRDESDSVDAEKAIEDAQKLYKAGKSNI